VIEPASLATLAEGIEISMRRHSEFPFRFRETAGVTTTDGRSWVYPAKVRRDFAVGYDGSLIFREALWEEHIPPEPPFRDGTELGACFTAERVIAAALYMQQLVPHFTTQSNQYEIILRLDGMKDKWLYCDAAEPVSTLLPFLTRNVCAEDEVTVGATFAGDINRQELLDMATKFVEQIATLFNSPASTDAIMRQVKKNFPL
jgi:hypothetical protein